ncbi:hypothetical protein [Agreia sp. Leaf283]|uniref:hypothetical protein n=1 Tax=Agreia sp. Leaf283 TaxID=1736321 RepID=UPI000B0D29E3
MAKKQKQIGEPQPGPTVYDPDLHPQFTRGIDGLLSVHRPVVIAHIKSIRKMHPNASTEQIIKILENRYLAAVTTGGAAVGASAVIPGIGVGVSLALTGVETAGFLEASALFAQSITEVHGIAVDDPDRARTLVMSMMMGTAGADLVRQLAGQVAGTGAPRTQYWGTLVTRSLPQFAVGPIADRLKTTFLKHLAARTGAGAVGRLVPFGVGAVIGGTGNHILGRKVVHSARYAFGPPPPFFPASLEPKVVVPRDKKAPKQKELTTGKPSRLPRMLTRSKKASEPEVLAPDAPGSEWPDVRI